MTLTISESAARAASGPPDYAVVAFVLLALLLIERELLSAYGGSTSAVSQVWYRALAIAWVPLLLALGLFAGAFVASYLF